MTTRQRALLALYRRLKAEGRDRDAAQVMETIMVIELQQNRARETESVSEAHQHETGSVSDRD